MSIAPVGEVIAQQLHPIGTLEIDGVTSQPVPVFSAGVKYTLMASGPGGGGAGRVEFGVFMLTKQVDTSSPLLLGSVASGRVLPEAKIDLFESEGTRVLTSYELTEVVVVGVMVDSVEDGKKRALVEEVSLDYRRIKQTVFTPSGVVVVCWDRAENRAC